jgi:glycosyltransferase involved in cell wall biosynthesis
MFNEKDNIREMLRRVQGACSQMTSNYEVIVVDDCSFDGSGALCDRLAAQDSRLRVLHHSRNRGLGGALRTGFAAARNDWVFYTDSDLPVDMQALCQIWPPAPDTDLVIGYRIGRMEGLKRDLMSFCYNRLIRVCFGLKVRDVNFAFKLMRRSLLQSFALNSEGSFIDAELLVQMVRHKARISQIPVQYFPRQAGVSTLASWRVVAQIFREMFCFAFVWHRHPNALPECVAGPQRLA